MQPHGNDEEVQRFNTRLEQIAASDHSVICLLWALARENDEFSAAQARIAAWVGRPAAEVGARLGDALARLMPHLSMEAACAAARPLLRDCARADNPTNDKRQELLVARRSVEYRIAIEEAANGSRPLDEDHFYTLATLYPRLPGPRDRLKALRHALATNEINLGLERPPSPRFDHERDAAGSAQERYRKLSRSDQERIIRFDKAHPQRVTSGAALKLEPRTRQILEGLFPDARTDVKLARALQFAIEHRDLDLDRR